MFGFPGDLIILSILLAVCIYLTVQFHKFSFISSLREKNRVLPWVISALPALICIAVFAAFSLLEPVISAIHLVIAFAVCTFTAFIIGKIRKKKVSRNISGGIAVILTAAYMIFAFIQAQVVVSTEYNIETQKTLSSGELKIAQITDMHLGTTFDGEGFARHLEDIEASEPDVLVVTGDLMDSSTKYSDMQIAARALGEFESKYGTYVVFGNHDVNTYGADPEVHLDDLIKMLRESGVNVLQDQTVLVDGEFYIVGRRDASERTREATADLLADLDKSKYILLLDHQPLEYAQAAEAGADLVLSGHTHGGQLFPLNLINEDISNNELVYGIEQRGSTAYIVSSGISEWGFSLRTGSPTEYTLITVESTP